MSPYSVGYVLCLMVGIFRSADGRILVVASTDGYCSIITFDQAELGVAYNRPVDAKTDSAEAETSNTVSPALQALG